MAIYDANGNQLYACYDAEGNDLNYAYDADGEVIFSKTPTTLKVMEYNAGQWYYGGGDNVPADKDAEYYALQNGMIQSADADIMIICEYWNQFSKLPRTAESVLSPYFPYILTQGGGSGYYGRAICSKYPLSNWTHHSYTNETSRYYDSADITVNNYPITLVVTHLNYNDESKRLAQLNELITYLSSLDRFICAGDLNTLDCKSTSGANYTDMIIPLLNAGFNVANCVGSRFLITYSDAPTGTWTGCLDNIITSSNISINSAYVDDTKLNDELTERTDHMPLIATIQLS